MEFFKPRLHPDPEVGGGEKIENNKIEKNQNPEKTEEEKIQECKEFFNNKFVHEKGTRKRIQRRLTSEVERYSDFFHLVKENNISQESVDKIVCDAFLKNLINKNSNNSFIEVFPQIKKSEYLNNLIQEYFKNDLTSEHILNYVYMKENYDYFDVNIYNNSTQTLEKAVQEALLIKLSDDILDIDEIIKMFPQVNIKSPEILEVVEEYLINGLLNYDDYESLTDVIEKFSLTSEFVDKVTKQVCINALLKNDIETISKIIKEFNISDEIKNLPEVIDVAQKTFFHFLKMKKLGICLNINNNFNLPIGIMVSELEKSYINILLKNINNDNEKNFLEGILQWMDIHDNSEFKELKIRLLNKTRQIYEVHKHEMIFDFKLFLQNQTTEIIDPAIKKTVDIFGDFADEDSYQIISKLINGELDENVKLFGVRKIGNEGLNQLEVGFQKFKSEITSESFSPQILLDNSIANKYFQQYIRFSDAQWSGDGHSFGHIVSRYIECTKEYENSELNPAYTPSEIMNINSIDSDKRNTPEYTEQFLNRFNVLFSDIKTAQELYKTNDGLSQIAEKLEEIKQDEIVVLQESLETGINQKGQPIPEKGKEFLKQKISKLESLDVRSLKDFQKNYETLSGLGGAEELLRQSVFLYAFSKNKTMLEKNLNTTDIKNPELDDISWTLNFIDHITNQETFAQYFTDKHALLAFEKTINTRALSEELSKFQGGITTGTKPFKFVPTRGLLMELSGHIADACWADKYNNTIPVSFPNFTAVTMVQNPDNKYERLAGSCMLIETTSDKGEPLLVIRGLNPLEGIINQLQVSDFYEQFTNYTKELAIKTGRKLAIVIDGHSGGSATNRPLLFDYLSSLELKRVTVPYQETEFNGYDISHNVFLVE